MRTTLFLGHLHFCSQWHPEVQNELNEKRGHSKYVDVHRNMRIPFCVDPTCSSVGRLLQKNKRRRRRLLPPFFHRKNVLLYVHLNSLSHLSICSLSSFPEPNDLVFYCKEALFHQSIPSDSISFLLKSNSSNISSDERQINVNDQWSIHYPSFLLWFLASSCSLSPSLPSPTVILRKSILFSLILTRDSLTLWDCYLSFKMNDANRIRVFGKRVARVQNARVKVN